MVAILPINIGYNDFGSDFLINYPYLKSGMNIPNLIYPQEIWIMQRYHESNIYIQFNRYADHLPYFQSFIIGKIDNDENFYKLNRNDFLICLKRYGRCIDPNTYIIWEKTSKNKRRKIVGKIDKYYNIYTI